MMALTDSQLYAVQITERTTSVLSLLGAAFIITTFLTNKDFHKPINRLVFYACWGNLMSNIGTIISISGMESGVDGPLCQFQGFLIQMFMPADALWTLTMACNVYLAFFRKYNSHDLRRLEWVYILLCYGIPFIPALVYCFITTTERGKIYGSAVMWCWVSIEWDLLRVAVFYGPVWLVILVIFGIYIKTGQHIFEQSRPLHELQKESGLHVWKGEKHLSHMQNPFLVEGITKTTDISISYEHHSACSSPTISTPSTPSTILTHDEIKTVPLLKPSYSVTIEGSLRTPMPSSKSPPSSLNCFSDGKVLQKRKLMPASNKAAHSYCKCAMLFFIALLVTWVPSSINRVYSLIHPQDVSFGLTFTSSLVLPLQGFWNTVIYVVTSFSACKALTGRLIRKLKDDRHDATCRTGSDSSEAGSLKKTRNGR